MLWNCRHFSVCSENVLPCETSGLFHWAWHPEQTSSASEGWLVGLIWKTWRYPWGGKFRNMFSNQSNFQNIHQFSNHIKKKKHYMKFIFNQRSGKNTQLNHSCMLFLPAPAISVHHKDCLSSSTMRACSACGKLNRAAARPYHRTIPGIWPSGKHTKSYWKLPFIVDLPIKNSDFP